MNWKIKFVAFSVAGMLTLSVFLPPWNWFDIFILGNLVWVHQAWKVWNERENYSPF